MTGGEGVAADGADGDHETDAGHETDGGHLGAIAALERMGPARLRALLEAASPREIWERLGSGTGRQLVAGGGGDARCSPGASGFDQSLAARPLFDGDLLRDWERQVHTTSHTPAEMQRRITSLGLVVRSGPELPGALGSDPDPPGVLFTAGSPISSRTARVAIVGTRRASDYGLRTARSLGHDLAEAGVEVVSGLALGIDAAAHAGALEGSHGRTPVVAVIGAGHHRPCPSRNRALARAVAGAGSVLSEVPPGIPSAPWRYPVRNRLIAGLADVVVVVESASAGGSMSTVAEALARDRVVMAVPGAVGRRTAEGCHDLLREGAEICTGPEDVLSSLGLLGFASVPAKEADGGDPEADAVLELLTDGPRTVDSLMSASGLDLGRLSSLLATMQTASQVSTDGGWVRRSL